MKFRLRLLLVAFTVSFLLVTALSSVTISRLSQLRDRVDSVEYSHALVNRIDHLEELVQAMDANHFHFLIGRDSVFLRNYDTLKNEVFSSADDLLKLIKSNPEQHGLIVLFESDMALYHQAAMESVRARISPDSILRSEHYQEPKRVLNSAVHRLSMLTHEENKLLARRTDERNLSQENIDKTIKALSILFGSLSLLLFFLLISEFRKRQRYQISLQQNMLEVAQSKQELEHIAYATSHDLQEPLRKIRILADKWQHQQNASAEDHADTVKRVVSAAIRMQDLVSELMILTTLNDDAKRVHCSLSDCLEKAIQSLSEPIALRGAVIEREELPMVNGFPEQLTLLFKNLIDNSLKFSRKEEAPHIKITLRRADASELQPYSLLERQYHCISFEDNGIGFENKMADKIFGIFRQLHIVREGPSGKGTGLAICQRIMSNHKGNIVAHGFPGSGAVFKLYFPVNER
jgi:signal transduction histidine kinase